MNASNPVKRRYPLFLALLLFPACFNPDDIFPVQGVLTSPDAVSGQSVRLLRDANLDGRSSCDEAKAFKETAADEAGAFSFDVFRAQAQKLTGTGPFCFRVETTFPSQSSAFSELRLEGEVTLPAFPDWRAQPSRVAGVLRFEPLAPLPAEETLEGPQLTHRAEWFTQDGGLAWVVDDRFISPDTGALLRLPMAFDDFVLEDFGGAVGLAGQSTLVDPEVGPFGGNSTTLEARSGQRLSVSGTRSPLSRGLACPAVATPCPLTDGDLTPVETSGVLSFTLTLATPAPLSAVVVRGAQTDALLVGVLLKGADGGALPLVQQVLPTSTWNGGSSLVVRRPRRDGGLEVEAQAGTRYFVIALDAGVPISAVTLGFAGSVSQVSEVSLFE